MMVSPSSYISMLQDKDYDELIKERGRLLSFIQEYEKRERAGDRSGSDWLKSPSPEVRYQVYLDYLAELCSFMSDKYNEEYVWGEKHLSESDKYDLCNTIKELKL